MKIMITSRRSFNTISYP